MMVFHESGWADSGWLVDGWSVGRDGTKVELRKEKANEGNTVKCNDSIMRWNVFVD